jgi:hypothetical protein
MPSHDARREPTGRISRRSVLQGAATAGAAGLAVTALGAAVSPAAAAATAGRSAPSARSDGATSATAVPIMVHVRNARTGDISVFAGTTETRLRDKDLAARIARASRFESGR